MKLYGTSNPAWKGGRIMTGDGRYWLVRRPEHPCAHNGYVLEHVLIAEAAMGGRPLRDGVEVHHVSGNGLDNSPGNLVVCHDRAYHRLIERRQKAAEATGDPSAQYCRYCKQFGRAEDMWVSSKVWNRAHHRACHVQYKKDRKATRRRNTITPLAA